jgi:hypothetical protein
MANNIHFAISNEDSAREAETIAYRQVEGAVAFVSVFAIFAAVVIMFFA